MFKQFVLLNDGAGHFNIVSHHLLYPVKFTFTPDVNKKSIQIDERSRSRSRLSSTPDKSIE